LISNANSFKEQRGATLVHRKYTKTTLQCRKRRTKLQNSEKLETGKLFHANLPIEFRQCKDRNVLRSVSPKCLKELLQCSGVYCIIIIILPHKNMHQVGNYHTAALLTSQFMCNRIL